MALHTAHAQSAKAKSQYLHKPDVNFRKKVSFMLCKLKCSGRCSLAFEVALLQKHTRDYISVMLQ